MFQALTLFFGTTASVPARFPGSRSPQALWVGPWASGSPFTCNLTCSHLCRCGSHPCRQGRGFFFNEKFFKFYSALQFFKSFAHVISYNPITTPPLFPYPYLAPPRIPLPSGNHWFVLCIFESASFFFFVFTSPLYLSFHVEETPYRICLSV